MALVRAMDVSIEQWRDSHHHHHHLPAGPGGHGAALEASMAPSSTTYNFASSEPPAPPSHQRAGTPCPTALREGGAAASFVLLPDGAGFPNRRFIELGAGTTVVSDVWQGGREGLVGHARAQGTAGRVTHTVLSSLPSFAGFCS